jgi:UDP-N-acetylmuramate--alanine ligase
MVVEADESDRSFLKLSPSIAVITNIDREHMESYGSWENLQQAFADFANKVPFYGAVIACADDAPVRELLPSLTRRVITYALSDRHADVVGRAMQLEAFGSSCEVLHRGADGVTAELGVMRLRVPGRHNLLNALAAIAVGLEAGVPFARMAEALDEFRGAERRFQMLGEEKGVMVVDDYGHHPTEIAAVIAAARAGINRRVVVVFQPHRYSRTSQLMREFGIALGAADEVVLTDIYSAGELPIPGVTIESLADAVRAVAPCPVHLVKSLEALPAAVAALARSGDLVVTLGAGSIGTVGEQILDAIGGRGVAARGRE